MRHVRWRIQPQIHTSEATNLDRAEVVGQVVLVGTFGVVAGVFVVVAVGQDDNAGIEGWLRGGLVLKQPRDRSNGLCGNS